MKSVNSVFFLGNCGHDAEVRYTKSGTPVANFSIAINEKTFDKQTNEKSEVTFWVKVVAFSKLAEIAGKYIKKGTKVFVQGKIRENTWEDNNVVYKGFNVIADELLFFGDRKNNHDSSLEKAINFNQPISSDMMDDDLPF